MVVGVVSVTAYVVLEELDDADAVRGIYKSLQSAQESLPEVTWRVYEHAPSPVLVWDIGRYRIEAHEVQA